MEERTIEAEGRWVVASPRARKRGLTGWGEMCYLARTFLFGGE